MESLIQLRLQSLVPSTIFSPLIQKRKLRHTRLHAKRRGSGGAVSVSESKRIPQEKRSKENRIDEGSTDAEAEVDDDEIPQPVFDRMLQRISISVGVPIGSGMTLIYVLDKLSKEKVWEAPAWLPFFIVLVSFGSGALAMAYGTLSTSWDPDTEGSFFGFEQIEKNWPVLWKEEIEKKELEKKRR